MTEEPEKGEQPQPADSSSAPPRSVCPVVGIGASAGGLDALRRLLPLLEPDSGMAFVVVQHLDPDHTSWLSELLARNSLLPVSLIEDDTLVQPDRVYVIPPNASLTIHEGRLRLARPIGPRAHRNTIDEFLTSLAHDQAENAACVILSGTGSDGTLGLRAIKENGGLTLAQSDAEYDGMMRSAMSTGLVDFILPLDDIPGKLGNFFDHINRAEDHAQQVRADSEAAAYLSQTITLLRHQTGHDFSNYKDRTIIRRIYRRMHVLQIDNIPDFISRLRRDNREVTLLFNDLLIGVTNFFRDPEAFAVLEREVVPELFRNKGADDAVRVWVPGCATGEEA
jgi:two-component system CheB/CheR fusion protein